VSEGAAKKEEKPRKFQAIRGTRDLLPPETALWNRVEQTAHGVFATFGFGEIRLPMFESTELFARAVGGETDIVGKEMYSFEDHDHLSLAKMRTVMISEDRLDPPVRTVLWFFDQGIAYSDAFTTIFSKAQVPRTPDNEWAERRLRQLADEARQRRPEFKKFEDTRGRAKERLITEQLLAQSMVHFKTWSDQLVEVLQGIQLGDDVSLRPEATASVCRAYIEHGMQQLPQPVKLYYMGPMFRRERPQKGRYRQFYQIGAEVLEKEVASSPPRAGVASKELAKDAAVDAEVIEMVMTFFDRLELRGVQLDINSIGDRNCRPKYVELLRAELLKVKDKLGADSQRRIETNPLRVLDSKVKEEQPIIEKLPRIADHLCEECAAHYAAVKHQLEMRGVIYRENWRLVRGLDYYMRTTFEITAQGLGSQNAVCGGGRYDGLVELLGGPPTKGIGFAIGEDRLILSLQESGKGAVATGRDVYIAWMGERAHATAIRAAKDLRKAGFSVELPPVEQKFGKALGQADKLGAKYALILGDNEVSEGLWTLKTLADGSQAKYTEPDLLEYLRKQKALSS
jgi:histidyl-tRNA synthetase